MAVQPGGEQLLAIGNALLLAHLLYAGGLPGLLGRLHDEGGHAVFIAVGMGLEPAVLGLHEGEGEGTEHLGRAQPHEAAAALVDIGPKGIGIARAHLAVDAVRGDDQVGVVLARHRLVVLHEVLEHQLHAHVLAARLQDVEQLLAAYADEAMAAAAQAPSLEVDVDIVPVVEGVTNRAGRHRIGLAQVVHGGVREHHAPTKGVVGPVALHHRDLVGGVLQLHQQAEVQAGGTSTDTDDLHTANPFLAGRRHRTPQVQNPGPRTLSLNSLGLKYIDETPART